MTCAGCRTLVYRRRLNSMHAKANWRIVVTLAALMPWPGLADTYRWYDDYGKVNYGEHPPPGAIGIERVETDECTTQACREEREQARAEAEARHAEASAWLDELDEERRREREQQRELERQRSQAPPAVGPVFVPVPAWPWAPRPYRGPPAHRPLPARPAR